ncbi:Na+/H+ antiporter subunit E [Oceanobacillus saliphilus]|uniref:Na+/H+ antiporter subunit E n=1 Tax=Oceanobacillus saliphilus TaxID=2925834 RepID=UPI00201E6774|nr:Na+/H+ antiporter subunit E [Oceanobacillus saliphilus]
MAFQVLLNVFIAVVWMFLQNNYTALSFFIGYGVGIFVLFVIRRFLLFDFYFIRVWAVIKLLLLFIKELIKANVDVVKIVLSPKLDNKPAIVAVATKLDTDLEVSILAALISLTPGTVSMDFSDDSRTIYIHSIDVPNKDEMVDQIHNTFERAIMEVTK